MRKTTTLNPVCLNLTLPPAEWPLARHPSVPKFSLLEYKDLVYKYLAGCCIKWGCIYRDFKIHAWWCVIRTMYQVGTPHLQEGVGVTLCAGAPQLRGWGQAPK